ncbi:MAG: hypothetical protein FWE09_08255 [Treponema sp.]|nr:hypothetical protein [Treponema sp.]
MSDDAPSDEQAEKKRPNAGYRLTRESDEPGPQGIVSHYDRDRRLEKAPQAVRDMYYGAEHGPRKRSVFGGKIQLFTMVAILIVCGMALAATLLGRGEGAVELAGNTVAIQAIRFEGTVIVALRKTARPGGGFLSFLRRAGAPYEGPVRIEARAIPEENGAPSFHMVRFTAEATEAFSFALPFDAQEIELVLTTDGGAEARVLAQVE